MTCHLAGLATVDGHSTAIGTGATGLGPSRVHPQGTFVHRNAPPLFNLATATVLTWDGRVFKNAAGVIRVPGTSLQPAQRAPLEFGALSALPMFPVLARAEMRGNSGNELAAFADDQPRKIWPALMTRLRAIPAYRPLFEAAYPGVSFDSMNFAHAGNAMGGWIAAVFTFTNSPWDKFLAGNDAALSEAQLRGAKAFLTTAKCAQCHNGPLLTDSKFHNVAIPQIGPGFGDGVNGNDDFGRFRQTGKANTRYQFRTAPLRNVELTAPYGHDGAIVNLRAWVDHYSQSDVKLRNYDTGQLEPLLRTTLLPTTADILATRDNKLKNLVIQSDTVDDITEFLKALTDPGRAQHAPGGAGECPQRIAGRRTAVRGRRSAGPALSSPPPERTRAGGSTFPCIHDRHTRLPHQHLVDEPVPLGHPEAGRRSDGVTGGDDLPHRRVGPGETHEARVAHHLD